MKRLFLIFASCILLLTSCSTTELVPITPQVPEIPAGEYSVDNLIYPVETIHDLMENATVYEHEYYRWKSYADVLVGYIKSLKVIEMGDD